MFVASLGIMQNTAKINTMQKLISVALMNKNQKRDLENYLSLQQHMMQVIFMKKEHG